MDLVIGVQTLQRSHRADSSAVLLFFLGVAESPFKMPYISIHIESGPTSRSQFPHDLVPKHAKAFIAHRGFPHHSISLAVSEQKLNQSLHTRATSLACEEGKLNH